LTQNRKEGSNIEDFVRIAAEEKDPAARQRLFRAIQHTEFFFPIELEQHGDKMVKRAPLLQLSDGTHAMMMYTSKSHPDLPHKAGGEFGGGSFRDALAAASKMPTLDWVIVTNLAAEWFSIHKEQLPAILANLDSHANGEVRPSDSGRTGDLLEDLISRASYSSTPEQLLPAISSALPGRELFLEMEAELSADGQPVMKTFRVNDMPTLRAYLTRKRPGITYGGMNWEALKDMIRKLPRIQGVKIVNDADDWILFDRASLGIRDET